MTARALALALALLAIPLAAHAQKPQPSTPITQASATVTTGGTFQTALAANPNRTNCILQNTSASDTGYVFWLAGGTATVSNSLQLKPGDVFNCTGPSGMPIRTLIQYTATTTGDTFMLGENN